MSDQTTNNEEAETRRLVVAINDFLRDQLRARADLVPEDRDCLEIAIQCLEMAFNLEPDGYLQYRFSRPLLDIFNQVTNPVSVRDKLRADAHKEEGNSFMGRHMYSNAESEYTRAIELDKWNSIYYCNRAGARIEQRNIFEAISDCRQALVLNPDYAKAHAKMGQAYALINRQRDAARCFRQAVELEPENERYRNNLRVAESQSTRPDPMAALMAGLLGSILGFTPRNDENGTSIRIPTSLMIITESHPPSAATPRQNTVEQVGNSENTENGPDQTPNTQNGLPSYVHPSPFDFYDDGSQEQAILEINIPETTECCSFDSSEEYAVERPKDQRGTTSTECKDNTVQQERTDEESGVKLGVSGNEKQSAKNSDYSKGETGEKAENQVTADKSGISGADKEQATSQVRTNQGSEASEKHTTNEHNEDDSSSEHNSAYVFTSQNEAPVPDPEIKNSKTEKEKTNKN